MSLVRTKTLNGLTIHKYSKKVFYKNLWDDHLENMRGLVTDEAGKIVQQPFTKIYNYGIEERAPEFDQDEPIILMEKVNGFMLAVTWYNEDFLVTTTGSLEGKFVEWGRREVNALPLGIKKQVMNSPEYTHLFEAVIPEDPHIISHPYGLYYLGSRYKEKYSGVTFRLLGSSDGNFHKVPQQIVSFGIARQLALQAKHEGYVVYSLDGNRATKLKSPFYLAMKFFARIGSVERLLELGKTRIAEEFYPLYDHVMANPGSFINLTEQERLDELLHAYWASR